MQFSPLRQRPLSHKKGKFHMTQVAGTADQDLENTKTWFNNSNNPLNMHVLEKGNSIKVTLHLHTGPKNRVKFEDGWGWTQMENT